MMSQRPLPGSFNVSVDFLKYEFFHFKKKNLHQTRGQESNKATVVTVADFLMDAANRRLIVLFLRMNNIYGYFQ